ncbi:sugar phosphate isomerase/epimerase family protein [Paenibacillus cremeus]|uniref:Sugar phosphate isomerase/epimerase n=1 Tax=Paenibacillus cremeus TaxID=2163881 RepID=A0A559K347_9BACL|nr:sugar phosphate isomerase/epimerase [Paenibacillus cremeus]TVY06552.1 sugar phosphate isomerase/epimerase [Paenibacillus cremeus]
MNLGIIGAPTVETLKMAVDKKLDFVEFCINVNKNVDDFINRISEINYWMDLYKVKVGSVGRWGSSRIDKNGIVEEEMEVDFQLIESASKLGSKVFVCGCNYVEDISYYENCQLAISYFSKLIDYGRQKGVQIAVYNCGWNNFVDNSMAWTIIHGYLKELGIKYDPSHSRYAGRDYLKEMRDWGDRFYHVHIKGSLIVDGERLDDPPAGLDQTDWGSFMAILYSKNYQGGLSIEPHSPIWTGELGARGIDYTVNMMKKFLL